MYFVTMDRAAGRLVGLEMTPLRVRRFRLHRAGAADTRWLRQTLDREGRKLDTHVELEAENRLRLHWSALKRS